ncbi:MAG: hypothetical protein QM617_02825 [Comamonas sp.]
MPVTHAAQRAAAHLSLSALLILALGTPAAALTLGPIQVQSALGAPLRAVVPLGPLATGELTGIDIRQAPAEAYQRQGLTRSPALESLQIRLIRSADGQAQAELTGHQPLRSPVVDLLLTAATPAGEWRRGYTLLLQPGPADAPSAPLPEASTRTTPDTPPIATPDPALASAPPRWAAPPGVPAQAAPHSPVLAAGPDATGSANAPTPENLAAASVVPTATSAATATPTASPEPSAAFPLAPSPPSPPSPRNAPDSAPADPWPAPANAPPAFTPATAAPSPDGAEPAAGGLPDGPWLLAGLLALLAGLLFVRHRHRQRREDGAAGPVPDDTATDAARRAAAPVPTPMPGALPMPAAPGHAPLAADAPALAAVASATPAMPWNASIAPPASPMTTSPAGAGSPVQPTPLSASAAALAPSAAEPLAFDLGPSPAPAPIGFPTPAAPSADLGFTFDTLVFELPPGASPTDIGTGSSGNGTDAQASRQSDLETRLALAGEFARVGDLGNARDMARLVLAEGQDELQARARALLGRIDTMA